MPGASNDRISDTCRWVWSVRLIIGTMARTTQSSARTSRQTARMGQAAALVVATGAVCSIAYFYMTSTTQLPTDDPNNVIDVNPIDIGKAGQANSGEFQILIVDEQDATRVTGVLSARSIRSENRTMYRVDQPDAKYFLDNGSVLHITADDGLVSMPSPEQQPEQGELSGHVRVRYYAPDENGHRVDTKTHAPDIDVTTIEPLRFDKQLGEVATTGRFDIQSEHVVGSGLGLTVALNEIEHRVSRIVIDREGHFRVPLTRARKATSEEAVAAAEAAPPVATDQSSRASSATNVGPDATDAILQPDTVGPATSDDVETAYRVTCLDDVVIELHSGERAAAVRSERLDAWFRLVNNSLPDGAVRPIGFDLESRREIAPTILPIGPVQTSLGMLEHSGYLVNAHKLASIGQPEALPTNDPGSTVASAGSGVPETGDVVTIACQGRMIVVPSPVDDAKLQNDDAALLLSSPESGVVVTDDLNSDSGGTSGDIEYFATRRRLVFHGTPTRDDAQPGALPVGIALDVPGFGTMNALNATIDLSTATAHVRGPASMDFVQEGVQEGGARFDESCTADLLVDGDTVYGIRSFALNERAELSHSQGAFRGDAIEGAFTRSHDGVWTISDIASRGNAIAIDRAEGWLEADSIAAHFDPGVATKNNVIVRTLDADGNVRGEQAQDNVSLSATSLAALFEPGSAHKSTTQQTEDKLRSVLVRADLFGDAEAPATYDQSRDSSEPVHASAEHIRLDAIARRATLISEGETPAVARAGGSEIRGPQLLLDSVQRSVWVFGEGDFTGQTQDDQTTGMIDAKWTTEMRYDDRAGRLLAVGEVQARVEDETGLSLDELKGHRLEAQITPVSAVSQTTAPLDPSNVGSLQQSLSKRHLQWAQVDGAVLHIEDESRATATSKRYELVLVPTGVDPQAPSEQKPRLVRLGYLEADSFRVDADLAGPSFNEDTEPSERPDSRSTPVQRLSVPGAGKMLILARSSMSASAELDEPNGASKLPDAPELGQSLFAWVKSMSLHQADARAELHGGVQMTHIREIDGQQTYIEAEHIVTSLVQDGNAGNDGSIRSALASESVYVRSRGRDGTREARAGIAEYDAAKGHVILKSSPGRSVTLYDPARGGVVEAGEIFWDLVKDEIKIRESSPFVGGGGR